MTAPFYILDDDDNPVETDQETWTRWHRKEEEKGDKNRCIVGTWTDMEGFGVTVSTVFVGWGHRLWETVISGRMFRGEHRYSSHADAVAGHERECKWRREFRARVRQARPDLDFDDMA